MMWLENERRVESIAEFKLDRGLKTGVELEAWGADKVMALLLKINP